MARRDRGKSKPDKTPTHSQRMNQLKAKALAKVAGRAWQNNQRYKTITLLSEALRRDPANPDILLDLAVACGKQRHYEKAEELLARLLELHPRKANIQRRVAQAYAVIDRPEQAVECYRRSLELNRDIAATVPTLLELAGLYERRHQLDDARTVLTEALARDPNHADAKLQQAIIDRRRGEMATAETSLRAIVANDSSAWTTRAQAWYELAQLLDDAQQYDDAFIAFRAAKQLVAPHAKPFLQQSEVMQQKSRELVAALDKSHFERWQELPQHDTPYRFAVLTSHPRSGTTLVEQVLDSHDEVISADEFDVFTQWVYLPIVRKFRYTTPILDVLANVPPAVRGQARATYWQQTEAIFDNPIGERMLLDKNPGMTLLLPVVNWCFPEMKTLFALRDPRDVILSCFMQKVPLTPISSNWLSLERAANYYATIMQTWLTVRPLMTSPWLEFRYEDVVADLEGHARRILEFLDLPWDQRVLKFHEHAREKMVRSPTYRDVTQPVYQKSVGRWQHYAKHFEPVLETLAPFAKEFGYK